MTIATRAAVLLTLASAPAGYVAIMVPDRRAGHYEIHAPADLAAIGLYELIATR